MRRIFDQSGAIEDPLREVKESKRGFKSLRPCHVVQVHELTVIHQVVSLRLVLREEDLTALLAFLMLIDSL